MVFRFEGLFRPDAEEFANEGVFSSCIVPRIHRTHAEKQFKIALQERKIDLVEVLEVFSMDPTELDPQDSRNALWIRWCNRAIRSRKVGFDIWHLFDPSAEDAEES